MALRAVTNLLRPAAVPVCDGFICLVPMEFSAGFGDNLYLGRLGASNATVPGFGMAAGDAEFPPLASIFSESDTHRLDLIRAARNVLSCSPHVQCVSMKEIISDASRKLGSPFLGVSAAVMGLLLAEGAAGQSSADTPEPQDVSAGQISDVIQLLKEQLSEVTDKAKNLDAENKKLREDVDKSREADNQRAYEIQMEIVRSRHLEEIARIQAGKKGEESGNDKKDDGSGNDKKDDGSGNDKKDDGSGNGKKDDGSGNGKKDDGSGNDKEGRKAANEEAV